MLHRHRIDCIVPPHMLRRISLNGTAAQRDFALKTLNISEQFRGQRLALAGLMTAGPAAAGGGKQRTVYDAQQGSTLPGMIVRREGDGPSTDPAVNEAYDAAGYTYDLYKDIYQRDSIDGKGLPINSSVHYQKGYDNAFWNGTQMVYGDGDEDLPEAQRLFNRFTISVDVIGHELTHGVTQYEAGLAYWEQPGALNESMSDVFGSLVKQYHLHHTADEADWIIGQGLFTANVNGVGIRSMKAPGTAYDDPVLGRDPQPAKMSDYVNTTDDSGGVHTNSGIPNHAFYLVATEIGGYAWEKAGQIWYITLRDMLQPKSDFQQAASLTFQVAGQQYGTGSLEQLAVKKGWSEVGIDVEVPAPTPTTPPSTPPASGDGCLARVLRAIGAAPAK
jgi:Zn-dependent metalloprotease